MTYKLPKGWVETTLGEITEPSRERALPAEVPHLPYVGLEHIEPQTMKLLMHAYARDVRSSSVRFSKGDVLYGKMRPYLNKVWVAEFDGLCSAEFLVFSKSDYLNNQFLALRLNSEDFVTFSNGQVSGERPRVDFEKLSRFAILLPPITEQERIVTKLNVALSGMERAQTAARRAQQRVQRYRAAVLNSAITGEITRAWREAQIESDNATSQTGEALLQRLLAARRACWEEVQAQRFLSAGKASEDDKWKSRYPEPERPNSDSLSELPQGWIWASLDEVLSVLRNGIAEAPHEVEGLPILRISAVRAMRVDLTARRYLPRSTAKKYRDYALQENDLLFTRYNGSRDLAGVCARVPAITETIVHPDKLIRGVPVQSDKHLSSFIEIAANTGVSRQYIEAHLFTTAGQWGISGRHLKPTPIPFPSEAEQIEISSGVERRLLAADQLTDTLSRQLHAARETRELLLHDAFTGRLVFQDPNDEPASVLLGRIRVAREAEAKESRVKRMPTTKSKLKVQRRPLLDVLRKHKKPMTPEQLFVDSGYQEEFVKNDYRQAVVDTFYEELRHLVEPKGPVLEKRPNRNKVLLEVRS
jgi:type I restriction enzyme, S subunit